MGKRLVVFAGVALAAAALAGPAAADLVPGGWADPIQVPETPPQPPEPAMQPPPVAPVVRAPVQRRVHRPAAPVQRALPDNQVQF